MRYREVINEVKGSAKIWKRIGSITMACLLLLSATLLHSALTKPAVSFDRNGNVTSLNRNSLSQIDEYSLELKMDSGKEITTKDVNIQTKIVDKRRKKKSDIKVRENEEKVMREAEVDRVLSELENSKSKRIVLPSRLEDGTRLKWGIKNKIKSDIYGIPILYMVLIFLVVGDFVGKKKQSSEILRNDIIRGLPRFTNQMLLMMNAGVILSDALERICNSYEIIPKDERSFFENALLNISETNRDSRISAAMLMRELSGKYNVKELMRISTILSENERRGSDIVPKLTEESRFLWEERKITAKERGKLIDTKMAWPLGLLLIMLIVITMAPALIAM